MTEDEYRKAEEYWVNVLGKFPPQYCAIVAESYLAGRESMRAEVEKKEVERKAHEYRADNFLEQLGADHVDYINLKDMFLKEQRHALAERERSAKLIVAIKDYIECDGLLSADGKPSFSAQEFIAAIAEYEASLG